MSNPLLYIRKLTIALMVSGALNIIMLIVLFYLTVKETVPTPYFELKPAKPQEQQLPLAMDHSNSEVIRYLRILPMERLIARLNHTQLIENGYTLRDLALACLVDVHHFDVVRALTGLAPPDQKRNIVYGKKRNGQNVELTVYAGLSDQQFQAIINFAATERWPLTSQGLFLALRKQKTVDQSLKDAFYMAPEFLTVEMLFGRAEITLEKNELLEVLTQGDWTMLSSFVEQQKMHQDLSPARRQRFLLDYIHHHSKAAALLLLKTDEALAVRKLDDNQVISILKLLDSKSPEAEKFAGALLTSPRSDAVWKAAAERLYAYAGEPMPEKYHHHAALTRFVACPETTIIYDRIPSGTISPAASGSIKKTFVPSTSAPMAEEKREKQPVKAKAPAQPVSLNNRMSVRNILPPAMYSKGQAAHQTHTKRLYIIQEGDSLWKIAKRFNVDVEVIKANNKLDSDFLKPGRPLIIP